MDTRALFLAVARQLEAEAFAEEEARQTRRFDPQERVAFRCGFYRGLRADVARAGSDVWERAASMLALGPDRPPHGGAP